MKANNQFAALMMFPEGGIFIPSRVLPPGGILTPPHDDLTQKIEIQANGSYVDVRAEARAISAVAEKAATLGYGWQDRVGNVTAVDGGYLGRYPNHDIYSAPGGAAVEIHGDIRAKYNALGGAAGLLGIPVTDELVALDGVGRYNHFKKAGSIFYSPRTGPMSVRGRVRDYWASKGWEHGDFGYPVQDQHRMIPNPPTDSIVEWCRFEHGVIAGDGTAENFAPAGIVSYAELGRLFGARLNEQFQASPDNVALRPGIDLLGISDWQYGFWSSVSRSVGFRIRGFHDNGLAPDTDFSINISLRFELVWSPSITEPTSKTLVAVIDFLRVIHDGGPPVVGGEVVKGVASAISGSFFPSAWPDPTHPEVPQGAVFVTEIPTGADLSTGVIDVLDVLVTAAGDLHVLVNPLAPPKQTPGFVFDWGHERQRQVQDRIDSL